MAQSTSTSLFGEEPDDDSFWLKLMSDCLDNPVTKLPTGKKLLVLGDNEADKALLISKLQGCCDSASTTRGGNGLEYRHLSVKDEYCDGSTKLGVWILDGDPFYVPLLRYALDGPTLADTTVLLVASMTRPWDILNTLFSWTEVLRKHIDSLNLPAQELELRRTRCLERFREYVEPGLSIYGSLAADNTRELGVNLGVELIVVVTKTEYMKELQSDFGYEEEHFDFIQLSLREFCLCHGAALFYVSAKEDKNCDLLLKYVLHRAYAFPFRLPGVLVERDSILVPAGWDTPNKIRFMSEATLTTIPVSTPYEEVVFRPARLADDKRPAPEVSAQRDQEFLAELQAALERQAAEEKMPQQDSAKDSSVTATVVQRNVARRMTRAQRSPQKKKLEAKLAAGEGDTTLSNFFHSLLNRRTSAPVDRPLGLSGARTLTPKSRDTENSNLNPAPGGGLQGIKEQQPNSLPPTSRKRSEEEDYDDDDMSSEDSFRSKLLNSVHHPSLDQDKGSHQLPEYFLSNPGTGLCSSDCSFQADSFDSFDDPFSPPPLDRVKSSFNPPLRLLLEAQPSKAQTNNSKELTNGEVKVSNGTAFGPEPPPPVATPPDDSTATPFSVGQE